MQVPSSSTGTDLAIVPAASSPERSTDSDFGRSLERLAMRHTHGEAETERDGIHVVSTGDQAADITSSAAPAITDPTDDHDVALRTEAPDGADETVTTPTSDDEVDVAVARSTQGPLRGALHAAAVAIGHGRGDRHAGTRATPAPAPSAASLASAPTDTVEGSPTDSLAQVSGQAVQAPAATPNAHAIDMATAAAAADTTGAHSADSPATAAQTPDASSLASLMSAVQAPAQDGEAMVRTRTPGEGPLVSADLPVSHTRPTSLTRPASSTRPTLPTQPTLPVADTDAAIAAALAGHTGGTTSLTAVIQPLTVATGTTVPAVEARAVDVAPVETATSPASSTFDASSLDVLAAAPVPSRDSGSSELTSDAPSAVVDSQAMQATAADQPSPVEPAAQDGDRPSGPDLDLSVTQAAASHGATRTTDTTHTTDATHTTAASHDATPSTAQVGSPADTTPPTEAPRDTIVDTPRGTELPAVAADVASSADEMVLRPLNQQAPLTTTAAATTAFTPAQTSALAARVEAAVEALRHAPPPREAVLDVDGVRVTVRLVGEVVHVSSDQLGGGGRDLGQALANRGLQLADGRAEDGAERQSQQQQPHSGQGSGRGSTNTGTPSDLTYDTRATRDAGVLL